MNTSLQTFDFNGHALRIFPTDDGQSFYAVAKDATDILGYRDAATGLRSVPDKHKGTHSVRTPGGTQEMLCVDESGLYRLILRSDKPEAEPFMELVTSEILPSIRKTGGYGLATQSQQLLDMQTRLYYAQERIIELLTEKVEHMEKAIKPKPRAATADEINAIVRCRAENYTHGDIAELLGRTVDSVQKISAKWKSQAVPV